MTLVKLIAPAVTLFSDELSGDSVYLLFHACNNDLISLGGGGKDVDPPAEGHVGDPLLGVVHQGVLLIKDYPLLNLLLLPVLRPVSPVTLLSRPELPPDLVSQDLTSHGQLVPHDPLPDSLLGVEANGLLLAPGQRLDDGRLKPLSQLLVRDEDPLKLLGNGFLLPPVPVSQEIDLSPDLLPPLVLVWRTVARMTIPRVMIPRVMIPRVMIPPGV